MPSNPQNGMPSTLCPGCGHWNDWQKVPGQKYNKNSNRRFDKPKQCEKCSRQLIEQVNPDRHHASASDQVALNHQRSLLQFGRKHGHNINATDPTDDIPY